MKPPMWIDAHQDIAYNALTFGRDIRHSAYETRRREAGSTTVQVNGEALCGWEEYQRGGIGLIFATLFVMPRRYKTGAWEKLDFATYEEAYRLTRTQLDYYLNLCDRSPDQFCLIRTRGELRVHVERWLSSPPQFPHHTQPVGLVLSMEGAEGVRNQQELEEWWQEGLRFVGPVWAGTRYCGGMYEGGGFTPEGLRLLEQLADMGYTLDIAHMNEVSALQALDRYDGNIIASHCNAAALLKDDSARSRHLSDRVIRRLAERDGVIGVVPFNRFLRSGWKNHEPREWVTLSHLAAHVDHICQVTGSVRHVGIGTDFDGGFGYPAVPLEMDTIADLPKLADLLIERGFSEQDLHALAYANWIRTLEQTLPA